MVQACSGEKLVDVGQHCLRMLRWKLKRSVIDIRPQLERDVRVLCPLLQVAEDSGDAAAESRLRVASSLR